MYQYDNSFSRMMNKLWDCLLVSLLWIVSSLPIVTLGASTSALYYTAYKVISKKNGHVWPAYWHSFRDNFKNSTIIMLIYAAVLAAFGGMIYWAYTALKDSPIFMSVVTFLFVFASTALMIALFTLAYAARFSAPLKRILKNGLLINILNMQWGIASWFVLLIAFIICDLLWPLPFFFTMPGFVAWIAAGFMEKVFRKYMSPEDIEKENNATQIKE